jgi:hypothetical protein
MDKFGLKILPDLHEHKKWKKSVDARTMILTYTSRKVNFLASGKLVVHMPWTWLHSS